jgi:hypothetical protein
MTWEEIERKNLIAAGVILADLAKYGAESGLAQWAVLVRARHPETSPDPPPAPPPIASDPERRDGQKEFAW